MLSPRPTLKKYLHIYQAKKNLSRSSRVRSANLSRHSEGFGDTQMGFRDKLSEIKDDVAIYVSDLGVQDQIMKDLDKLLDIYEKDLRKKTLKQEI